MGYFQSYLCSTTAKDQITTQLLVPGNKWLRSRSLLKCLTSAGGSSPAAARVEDYFSCTVKCCSSRCNLAEKVTSLLLNLSRKHAPTISPQLATGWRAGL